MSVSPSAVWCLYSRRGVGGGPAFIKRAVGVALLGFASRELAEVFLRARGFPASSEVVALDQLGSAAYPNRSAPWLPETCQIIFISTSEELRAYALAPESFVPSTILTRPIRYGPADKPNARDA